MYTYETHNSGLFFKHVEETMIKKEGKIDDDDNKSFIISSHANYGAKPMIKTKKMYKSYYYVSDTKRTHFLFFFSCTGVVLKTKKMCKMAR